MASRKAWGEFFAQVTDKYRGGVLDTLLTDWRRAQAQADELPPPATPAPSPRRLMNRDTPQRIAQLLAERLRAAKW